MTNIVEDKCIKLYKDYRTLTQSIGGIQKGGLNPHFKNKYIELNTALDVINAELEKHNFLCFVQTPHNIDGKNFLHTVLMHSNGMSIESDLELVTTRQDPQMLGSSLTYARRYSLITMLGLKAEDDDGNKASGKEKKSDLVDLTPLKARMNAKGDKFTIKQYLDGFKKEGINLTKDDERILTTHYNTNMKG